jgi:beta-glucosidase
MSTPKALYLDPRQPLAARVADLIGRLTPAEKVSQLLHTAPAIERLGVPAYNWWNECLHGVGRAGRATVFPQAIGMAASFDPELLLNVATAISDEARAKHHQALRQGRQAWYFGLTFWSPNINIFRDPRWGRGQETYGEDPYLTSRLAVAFIRGLQGDDPVYRKLDATAKHFAVHSGPERARHGFDAVVSGRDLQETYLRAFKAAVTEAGVACVMGAYNRTNGEPCCASPTLLQQTLREEWGFTGYVVSDCGAICDIYQHHKVVATAAAAAALALQNGCDLNCGQTYGALLVALDQGLITEPDLDVALTRLFSARFQLGMFDPPEGNPHAQLTPAVVNCDRHRSLARQMAQESIVLLKNAGGLLPLRPETGSVAVVGPCALDFSVLWGNYNGFSGEMVTPFEGIVAAVAAGTEVTFSEGCKASGDRPIREGDVQRAVSGADVIVAVLGYTPALEGEEGDAADSDESGDRRRMSLPGRQQQLLEMLCATGKPVVLVVCGGSPVDLAWAKEHVPAILMLWYPGEQGGRALADVLFGRVSPSGRLPITFVRDLEALPPFADYAMAGRTYRFMDTQPLYPFGYGLSYSTFEYSDLQLSAGRIGPADTVEVRCTVSNRGSRRAAEVVQLYVQDLEASVPVPRCHLEGVCRVDLEAGAAAVLRFPLGRDALCCYTDAGVPFVEAGEFEISVGGRQPDVGTDLPVCSNLLRARLTVA